MDAATQGVMILATFSLAHERVLEFLRWWIPRIPSVALRKLVDTLTSGAWAWIPGVVLAVVTNANLLDVFRTGADHQPAFTSHYLHSVPDSGSAVIGCCLMGLAVTLGSSFWHDLAKGLMEMRAQINAPKAASQVAATSVVVTPAPASPDAAAPAAPVITTTAVAGPVVLPAPPPIAVPAVGTPVPAVGTPVPADPPAIGGATG